MSATIHYTLRQAQGEPETPTAASTEYTGPITLTDTTTVKAVAVLNGETSAVASRTFTKGSGGETETE